MEGVLEERRKTMSDILKEAVERIDAENGIESWEKVWHPASWYDKWEQDWAQQSSDSDQSSTDATGAEYTAES